MKFASLFICNFVHLKSIGGKNMHTFYQLGKKYAFSPLSIIFFSNMLFGHIFVKQKNIHPCLPNNSIFLDNSFFAEKLFSTSQNNFYFSGSARPSPHPTWTTDYSKSSAAISSKSKLRSALDSRQLVR